MGFRFFRRMKIAPGISLNFSRSGISPSFGVRGARVTLGRRGVRHTLGIPGTGLFYTRISGAGRRGREAGSRPSTDVTHPPHGLDLGFFERLVTPKDERAFVEGCGEYVGGRKVKALQALRGSTYLADGAFLAGFLAMGAKRYDEAADYLKQAVARHRTLGRHFDKYGLRVELSLPITREVFARITPCRRGALLGLVEVHQYRGETDQALACLKQLRRDTPEDVVVNLSMAELLYLASASDKRVAKQIAELASGIKNESPIHAALMLYQARALRVLGLDTAARDVLTAALRRKKGREPELLCAIRYERACLYEQLGEKARARREYEKLYAQDPGYMDLAERLGL